MANEEQINTPLAENAVIVDDEPKKSENEDNLNDIFSDLSEIE